MTRRRRRATSSPQRVGSDAGLTSSRPTPPRPADAADAAKAEVAAVPSLPGPEEGSGDGAKRRTIEQTKDDTDEGWGERGDDDATGRWLRENRPPHWS
ncbi:hypothetical protein ACOCJ5_11050 [Knoellia sp. CPCC 206450]|uniref:hypothetical protein n=1 Tax=Knoellia tibetensis TaxID=3404798 RepID=UPI003B436B89